MNTGSPTRIGFDGSPAGLASKHRLAGMNVSIRYADERQAAMLEPWLGFFLAGEGTSDGLDLDLSFEIAEERLETEEFSSEPVVEYLYVSAYRQNGRHVFRGTDGSGLELSVDEGRARGWVPQAALDGPPWVLRDLFNAAFTTLLRARGRYPLHAAALAREAEGLLVVGPPMAGKTSVALNFLRRGWSWVADDKVLLSDSPEGVVASGLFKHFNIDPGLAAHFPELAPVWRHEPLHPHSDKRGVDLEAIYGSIRSTAMRTGWILFPVVVDLGPSEIEPLPEREAFLELVRQMPLVNDPVTTRPALALIAKLAGGARSFRLRMGRDLLEDPECLPRLGAAMGLPVEPPRFGS